MSRARLSSDTESAQDLVDYQDAEMDAGDSVGARDAAGGGNQGVPLVAQGLTQHAPNLQSVINIDDFLSLPNFSRYTPVSSLIFSESDLCSNVKVNYFSNPSTLKLIKYSDGELQGNLFLEIGFALELPYWN